MSMSEIYLVCKVTLYEDPEGNPETDVLPLVAFSDIKYAQKYIDENQDIKFGMFCDYEYYDMMSLINSRTRIHKLGTSVLVIDKRNLNPINPYSPAGYNHELVWKCVRPLMIEGNKLHVITIEEELNERQDF